MDAELKSLKIDKSRRAEEPSKWAVRWIVGGVLLFLLAGAGWQVYQRMNAPIEVEAARIKSQQTGSASSDAVVLNATGYIIAAHKIEVAAKVVGKVAWIGVEKGDKVKEGQILVRLEDDEYRAQLQQAQGQLTTLQARLAELVNGSRPEEIATAKANVEQAEADLVNARINLDRTKKLWQEGVFPKSNYDDAQAKFDSSAARVNSLQKVYELVKIGPRKEVIDQVRGQIDQMKGLVAFMETQLANTVIKAPVTGTILERAVERGEFVTTSFVGDRGAKGYVVSLADLNDLQVELDISQNDFRKLHMGQNGIVTVDAFPDARWDGVIAEVSPEANRQKATVQVKVKILKPDDRLRPEMNAAVAFLGDSRPGAGAQEAGKPVVFVPPAAVRGDKVLVIVGNKVVEKTIKTSGATPQGLRVEDGLVGGEDVVLNPPADLKPGMTVKKKGA
jgi:HlyD family secretion protein